MIAGPSPSIGIDLGGTKLAVGGLAGEVTGGSDPEGLLGSDLIVPIDACDYEATVDAIAGHVRRIQSERGWGAPVVGVAIAAFLSPDRGVVVEALNLGWKNKRLGDDLAERTGLKVVLHNDANAAAWGEYLLAGSPDRGSLITLTLGTDVGGGVIADGRLLTGAFGIGGELGHLVVMPNGPVCVCGARGCLAVYASGKAITSRARQALQAGGGPVSIDVSPSVDVSAEALTRLVEQRDSRILAVLDDAARAIAAASAQISRVIDHHTMVIGGGASRLGSPLVQAIERHLEQGGPIGPIRPVPRVLLARAGNRAGVIGAADLARRETVSVDATQRE